MELPTFGPDDAQALNDLRDEVLQHRTVGRVHVEFRRLLDAPAASASAIASAFVKSLAWQAPEQWTSLDASGALEVVTRTLALDLAYETPVMTIDQAQKLARRFVQCLGDGAVFLTNGMLALAGTARQWSPLTNATFDTGVVGVSESRIGLLWVEDED
jgi:hypothetical protein